MYSCIIINLECIFLILRTRNASECLATKVDVKGSEWHLKLSILVLYSIIL